jgi:hypothetical protein
VIGGRYRLETRLGAGGAGVVWRAEDTLLRRSVAIKEVQPDGDGERNDMLREARAAARLDHPGAVTVYDVVHDAGRDYIVMQLVEGPNLAAEVADRGPLDGVTTANLGLRLLDVVEAAHGHGLIHRDIKPANVMFPGDGRAQLTDFGIARLMDDPRDTTTGLVRGTPQYMSPEQAVGGPIGPATDLWSLGATLYFAMEGTAPFDKGQALATLNAITAEPPRPAQRAGPLEDVLEILLSKDPEDRSQVNEIRRRLRAVADSGAPTRELLEPWATSAPALPAGGPRTVHPPEGGDEAAVAPPPPVPADAPWPDGPQTPPSGMEEVRDSWPEAAAPPWEPAPASTTTAHGWGTRPDPETGLPARDAAPEPDAPSPPRDAVAEPDVASPAREAAPEPDAPSPPRDAVAEPDVASPAREAVAEPDVASPAREAPPVPAGSASRGAAVAAPRPATTPEAHRSGRTRRAPLAAAAVIAVALAAVIAVIAGVGSSGSSPRAGSGHARRTAAPQRTSPSTHPATSAPPAASGANSGPPPAAVPADWVTYTDPQTGFRLRYPPGWRIGTESTRTTFTDPATGDYVLIDHQTPPASTPQGPWYTNEPGFAASHAGYQRIGITTTQFHGYPAALWEYEYNSGAERLHAIDLGMIVGSHGYAFNFQASAARWAGDQQEMDQLEAGFVPAG